MFIDTHNVSDDTTRMDLFLWAMSEIMTQDRAMKGALIDDVSLITMGIYIEMVREWRVKDFNAPTMSIHAESFPEHEKSELGRVDGDRVEIVTGSDHFSLLDREAGEVAAILSRWIQQYVLNSSKA